MKRPIAVGRRALVGLMLLTQAVPGFSIPVCPDPPEQEVRAPLSTQASPCPGSDEASATLSAEGAKRTPDDPPCGEFQFNLSCGHSTVPPGDFALPAPPELKPWAPADMVALPIRHTSPEPRPPNA